MLLEAELCLSGWKSISISISISMEGDFLEGRKWGGVFGSSQTARARRWFLGHGFEIEKTLRQRDGGRVVAARQPFQEAGYARCAWAFRMGGGAEPAARITVIAAGERGGKTRVTAKVDIALVNTYGDRAPCASHGALEQEILAAVAASG